MRTWWDDIRLATVVLILWRIMLSSVEWGSGFIFPVVPWYLGTTPWGNFDGVHYLSISAYGYGPYQQAFFPFYPLIVRVFTGFLGRTVEELAIAISLLSLLVGLVVLIRLCRLLGNINPLWVIALLLAFVTSFFFAAIYSTSLYFMLATVAFYAIKRRNWLIAGIAAALASATQLFGVFLIIPLLRAIFQQKQRTGAMGVSLLLAPLGLVSYMGYLWQSIGDPFAFFHAQPAFGAGRSGSSIVLLPQVLYRYGKILTSVDATSLVYHVALLELLVFVGALTVLWISRKSQLFRLFGWYCLFVIVVPSLTGTLSSMPRYVLSAFPLFMMLASIRNKTKVFLVALFVAGLVYFMSAFIRGHFVA